MSDFELDPKQREAIDLIVHGSFGIITGGPGTGKTTCLREAIRELRARGRSVTLLAPTGKAALRMTEATSHEASTIHRALGALERDDIRTEYLVSDVVIVDEASMLDVQLAAWLFSHVDTHRTSVFFVGDVNQLPSVGPGLVLGDLIASEVVPVVCLETLHRSARESWIYRNAPRILAGDIDALELEDTHDFVYHPITEKQGSRLVGIIEHELNEVQRILDRPMSLEEALSEVQILIPMRKRGLGVGRVNSLLQHAMQGQERGNKGWALPDETKLYPGDKVMQTKNDYHLGLMNGEQGIVEGTKGDQAALLVDVAGKLHAFSREQSRNLQLSYATTIHKSQGSEWPVVIVVCHSDHQFMLTRQLLYTAVTRAKKRLVLVGDDAGIAKALKTSKVQDRQTGLREAVRAAVGGG